MEKTLTRMLLIVVASVMAAACGPTYVIVRQPPPNPYQNIRNLVIEQVRFDGLQVGRRAEAEWQASKSEQERQSWQVDKAAMANELIGQVLSNLIGRPIQPVPVNTPIQPGSALVSVSISYIEPGQFNYFMNIATAVHARVQVIDSSGQTIDAFATTTSIPATLSDPASGSRMREAARIDGLRIARSLNYRIRGE